MLHAAPGMQLGRTYGIEKIVWDEEDRLISAGADGACRLWGILRHKG